MMGLIIGGIILLYVYDLICDLAVLLLWVVAITVAVAAVWCMWSKAALRVDVKPKP